MSVFTRHLRSTWNFSYRVLLHLAEAMGATLIHFDLEDLKDLGWEFTRQEPPLTPQDRKETSTAESGTAEYRD